MRRSRNRVLALLLSIVFIVGMLPMDSIRVAAQDVQAGLDESQWNYAKLGTQSDKMKVPVYKAADNKLTFNTGSAGKMANTGQSGFVTYYTKIKSADTNFTMRGRFHVTGVKKQDNQSSFGLIALDSLGNGDGATDYINQIDIYAATKNEKTGSCIPGIRTYFGNTDVTGQKNLGGTCDVTQYFDSNATIFSSSNAADLYYNFEMVKDCNGYVCNWYNDDWSEVKNTIRVYNPERLLQQDGEYVYVGFYASRIGTVEVTDISYEQHTPTAEELSQIDRSKWVDYDEVKIKTFNGTSTSDSDYRYRFTSNVTGTVSVSDSNGNDYIKEQPIANGDTVDFTLSDYGYELPMGETIFTTVVTPAENIIDANGVAQFEDRLVLQDYSPVTVEDTVVRKQLSTQDGVMYVSPEGTADGNGTTESPYDLDTAVSFAAAGDTIILLDGTYTRNTMVEVPYSVSGTEAKPIVMKAEHTGKAVIEGSGIKKSSDSVLFLKGNYWKVEGITVCKSSDGTKGIHVTGNHNTFTMCEMFDNGSTGLQISYSGGEPKKWWPSYNTILNCTSYNNCDGKQNDADGFAAKLSVGPGNVFDGCISHHNADDGYDLYAKDKAGYGPIEAVIIQNCLAYDNGILMDGSYAKASANGFKLGGEGLTGKHVLRNSVSWNNGGSGIMSNNGPDCQVYNCISVDNGLFSRVGKTDDRNNYQLTPKNGAKYLGQTGYVIENSLGFYTKAITNYGTMASDKFVLLGQDESIYRNASNYLCMDISKAVSDNTEGVAVEENWFESVDYANITPTRNEDGSIDMHGLFVLTSKAPKGIGAVINESKETPEEPTEPEVKPTEPEVKPTEPEIKPTEPEVKPTEPEVTPTEPTTPEVKPTEPEVKPTEPTTPEVKPTEPEVTPTEPTTPEVKPTEPEVTPTEPTTPEVKPTEPEVTPTEPTTPEVEPTKPVEKLSVSLKVNTAKVLAGNTVIANVTATGGDGDYTYRFLVYTPATKAWETVQDYAKTSVLRWKATGSGARHLYVEVKDGTGETVRSKAFGVTVSTRPTLTVKASTSRVATGNTVRLTATASQGSGKYTYRYIMYTPATKTWTQLQGFGTKNTYTWKATGTGARHLYVEVKDSNGTVTRSKAFGVTVTSRPTVAGRLSTSKVAAGNQVTIKATASQGSGKYTYRYVMYTPATKEWKELQGYSAKDSYTWTATGTGARHLYIDVKDSNGTVTRSKAYGVTVVARPAVTVKISTSKIRTKGKVTITATASQGSGQYTYRYIMYTPATKTWTQLQGFGAKNTYTWTATGTGARHLYVEVKDSNGTVTRSKAFGVTVTK